MALERARPGEVIDVRPLGQALTATPSHALIRTPTIELMRNVLRQGEALPPHALEGEVTVQCLEGRVRIESQAGEAELGAGQLVLLPGRDVHAVHALEDASLLVTILRRGSDVKSQDGDASSPG